MTPFDAEMARLAAERARKLERAEAIGNLGKPIPHLFLDSRSGCLLAAVIVGASLAAAPLAMLGAGCAGGRRRCSGALRRQSRRVHHA